MSVLLPSLSYFVSTALASEYRHLYVVGNAVGKRFNTFIRLKNGFYGQISLTRRKLNKTKD